MDIGELITDLDQIGTQFITYYHELFTAAPLEDVDIVLDGIKPSVTDEMNLSLTCQFSEHEVAIAMK